MYLKLFIYGKIDIVEYGCDCMKKFVKVLDGELSNASGIKYKIGEVNIAEHWDPKASSAKEMGGYSFSSEDKILRWLLRGDTIYDVDIPIDAEVIEIENVNAPHGLFRTNKIILNNPRRLDSDLVMELYLKSDLPLETYFQCLTFLSLDCFNDVCKKIIVDKIDDRNVEKAHKIFSSFFDLREEDKTDIYNEVDTMLSEIEDKDLINVAISRDPLVVKITNDRVINITGMSGAGKTTYVREHYDSDNYLLVDTDEIFSDKHFASTTGINKELGTLFREKFETMPTLDKDFDIIYDSIIDYCSSLDKTIIIDCAQFHCASDVNNLIGEVVILRTDVTTCYNRCLSRYINRHKDYTEAEINEYKERKRRIFVWYRNTNEFIKKLLKY